MLERRVVAVGLLVAASFLGACSKAPPSSTTGAASAVSAKAISQPLAIERVDAEAARLSSLRRLLRATATPKGTRLESPSGAVTMRLSSMGRGALGPLGDARVEIGDAQVTLRREGVEEWLRHDDRNVEEGIDVQRRPEGEGPLTFAFALDEGARVESGKSAQSAMIVAKNGARFALTQLAARDAEGRALDVRFEGSGAELRYVVEDGGARYPIEVDPLLGAAPIQLVASDGTNLNGATAISGLTVVVGNPGIAGGALSGVGEAYVFARTGTTWAQQAKLAPPTPAANLGFGSDVAISGSTLVALTGNSGAYVFVHGATWTQQQILNGPTTGEGFYAFQTPSLDGNLLALGDGDNPGTYVFARTGTTWVQQAELAGGGYDGGGVAISGTTVITGSYDNSDKGTSVGAAYVYVQSGTTWPLQATLYPADAPLDGGFGAKIALQGNTALIGDSYVAGVYVFTRTGTTWSQTAKLTTLSTAAYDGDAALSDVGALGASPLDAGVSIYTQDGFLALDGNLAVAGQTLIQGSGATWSPVSYFPQYSGIGGISGTTVAMGGQIYELAATLPNASACTDGAQCLTGYCIDGVCCDSACGADFFADGSPLTPITEVGGSCLACTAALKGSGVDGVCGPIAADTDPRSACTPDTGYPTSCKGDGFCDGTGVCRAYAKPGTTCGASTCNANITSGQTCNGFGSCQPGIHVCAPYVCAADGTSCTTSCAVDTDCGEDAYCDGTVCTTTSKKGKSCTTGNECTSGFCVDGVCCDASCGGQCQSCNEPGSVGSCATVKGPPASGRAACATDGSSCGGSCDGVNAAACTYPAVGATCGAGCASGAVQRCDGAGKCLAASACAGNLACADDKATCRSVCVVATDCVAGFVCSLGACVPPVTRCSGDRTESVPPNDADAPEECAPYLCGSSGLCLKTCATADDCANGNVCSNGACLATSNGKSGGGCAVGQGANDDGAGAVASLLAIGGVVMARRKTARGFRVRGRNALR